MTRIKRITVTGFRGIRNSIELDLTSRLTLIYAPNGTGKTSVCDAAEWLMTGGVKRLNVEQKELRCQFSPPEVETAVTADFEISGEQADIVRTLTSLSRVQNNRKFQITDARLLEMLAPTAAEESAHGTSQASSRRIWLRGTRFLSSDSLSMLLDSDDEFVSAREKIFADLLGVGHLHETEKQVENYMGRLRPAISRVKTDLEKLEGELAVQKGSADEESRSEVELQNEASAELVNTGEALGISFDAGSEGSVSRLKADLGRLELATQERQEKVEEQSKSLALVEAEWSAREEWERLIATYALQMDTMLTRKGQQNENATNIRGRIRSLTEEMRKVDDAIELIDVAQSRLGSDLNDFSIAAERLAEYAGADVADFNGLMSRLEPKGPSQNKIEEKAALERIKERISLISALKEERDSISRQVASLTEGLSTADQIASVEGEIAKLTDAMSIVDAQFRSIAGPLEQLRSLAIALVGSAEFETECPVCGHDHESHAALQDAIRVTSLALTPQIANLTTERERLKNRISEITVTREQDKDKRYRLNLLQAQLSKLNTEYEAWSSELAKYHLSDTENLSARISSRVREIDFLEAASRLITTLEEIEIQWSERLPKDGTVAAVVARVAGLLARRRSVLEASAVELQSALTSANNELSASNAELEYLVQEMERLTELNLEARQFIARFEEAWGKIAPGEPISKERLRLASVAVLERAESTGVARQSLEKAARIVRFLEAKSRIGALEEQIRKLRAELRRLTELYDAAETIKSEYANRRTSHVRVQLREIIKVISVLFSRMQANQVYDSIRNIEGQAPLTWQAVADKMHMSPQSHFSQGQRQDFALAIYMARARTVGGTFFLDEPVAHMDDLNRVALLDVMRVIASEAQTDLSMVVTTANRPVFRHFVEKFQRLRRDDTGLFKAYELSGNARYGVEATPVELAG